MDTLLKTLAVFFAVLFIVTTAMSLTLYNVERSVFDAQLYIRALEEENVYDRLPELAAQSLAVAAKRTQGGTILSLFKNLPVEEWRRLFFELIPPEVLRSLAEDVITQLIAYLNGERESVLLPLAELKAHMQSPQGVNAIYEMLKSQPDCTAEQLGAMALGQQDIVLCNPPETFLFIDLRPVYEGQIKASLTLIPEEVTLISPGPERLQQLRDLQAIRTILRLTIIMPIICLLMIVLFAVRSFWDWLNWWGYPMLLAGLVSLFLSALSGPVAAGTFQFLIAPVLPDAVPAEIISIFRDLTGTIVGNAMQPAVLIGGIMAFLGLVMVSLALLLGRRLKRNPQYVR